MQGIPQGQSSQGGGTQPRREAVGVPTGASGKPSLSWQSPSSMHKPVQSAPDKPKTPVQQPLKLNGEKSKTGTYVMIFVAGLVVGLVLGWGIVAGRSGTNSNATTTAQGGDASNTSVVETSNVVVPSPQNAGAIVTVSKVDITKPTWVAVYANKEGVPGGTLGATLFWPASMGGKTSGTIELLTPTVAGKTYLIGQQIDDGNRTYSHANDQAVVDADGKQILTVLVAQ